MIFKAVTKDLKIPEAALVLKQISLPLQSGQAIRLQGDFPGTAADFCGLSRLLSLPLEPPEANPHCCSADRAPADTVLLYESRRSRIVGDLTAKVCYFTPKDHRFLQDPVYCVFVWHGMVLAAASAALLRGENVLLIHGAMLEQNGEALLLCGESGVGKSTTSCRWRQIGNRAVADDMILLEFSGGDILAHRLPTWSACREGGVAGKSYPFAPALRVKNILALGRSDDHEKISPLPEADFLAQLYHCAYFHYEPMLAKLPEQYRYAAAEKMAELFWQAAEISPPRALLAALDGNLNESLRGLL